MEVLIILYWVAAWFVTGSLCWFYKARVLGHGSDWKQILMIVGMGLLSIITLVIYVGFIKDTPYDGESERCFDSFGDSRESTEEPVGDDWLSKAVDTDEFEHR